LRLRKKAAGLAGTVADFIDHARSNGVDRADGALDFDTQVGIAAVDKYSMGERWRKIDAGDRFQARAGRA
jgi:hypothetical protein